MPHCHPSDHFLDRAVVLTALSVEFQAVCAHLTARRTDVQPTGGVYEIGVYPTTERAWEVCVAAVGTGATSVAIEAEQAVRYFDPRVLMVVGIAGGLKDTAIGDVVVCTKMYAYQFAGKEDRFSARPDVFVTSPRVLARARAEAHRKDWFHKIKAPPANPPRILLGPMAAGERVVADRRTAISAFVQSAHSDALALEMEGAGIMSATGAHSHLETIVIRGISDQISSKKLDTAQAMAADHAAAFAYQLLARLGRPHQVFLSYAHEDKATAQKIAESLRSAGIRVWFDQWELRAGDSIAARANQAVAASDVLLVLLSRKSVSSRWMRSELAASLSRELNSRAVTVIPAIIEDCEVPTQFVGRVALDLRTDREDGVQRLVEQLTAAVHVDFSRMDATRFEQLIGDLLEELGFSVQKTAVARGSGFDFEASHTARDPFGAARGEPWLVDARLYRDQRVDLASLRQMTSYLLGQDRIHRGLVLTNGRLTSVAQEFLSKVTTDSGCELRVVEGAELTSLLIRRPNLVNRYFGQGADQ